MVDYAKYEVNNEDPSDKKRYLRTMFDSIVPTYDFLNRILSMGIDARWRRDMIRIVGDMNDKLALDLCCGTGDLTHHLVKTGALVHSLDFSFNMLIQGRKKGWLGGVNISGDATKLPFREETFDLVTTAFGIRNIPDVDVFLAESHRVLKTGEKLMILELTRPENSIVRFFYNFYLIKILPFIGGIISGRREAYRYLSGSISTFLDKEKLVDKIKSAGFTEVTLKKYLMGVSTLYLCKK